MGDFFAASDAGAGSGDELVFIDVGAGCDGDGALVLDGIVSALGTKSLNAATWDSSSTKRA